MCGIAGILVRDPRDDLAPVGAAMLDRLQHRGPDDHGWLTATGCDVRVGQGVPARGPAEVTLLHRRLSILDLSEAGRQPMSSADGRYHIVFNGEIYNYVELRAELAAAGVEFHTQTDTEVLLAALAHWGVRVLPRLVGMFAFALLDNRERTLLLARDFFGIKPLYYTRSRDRFAFASEIRALLELPGLSRRVNPDALANYLTRSLTDQDEDTMLAAISQIPPAHYLRVPLDRPNAGVLEEYWRIDLERPLEISFAEAARRLRDMFLESVRLHLRSDVPVGTALSGGIDSSSIAAAVRQLGGAQTDFHTFSFIAAEPCISEEEWVDIAGAASGATLHKVRINSEELIADLGELIVTQGQPFDSMSIYAQYRVFRAAHEAGVKVLLDGQGADELLAGYSGFVLARLVSLLAEKKYLAAYRLTRRAGGANNPWAMLARAALPSRVTTPLVNLARRVLGRGGIGRELNTAWFRERGALLGRWSSNGPPLPLRTALRDALLHSTLPTLLRYEDRNSMAFGVESRVPFLTPQLAEFILSLPEEYLIGEDGTQKRVFRAAMRGIVPDRILDRRDKIGFATPDLSWLQSLRPWVQRTLSSDTALRVPALHHAVVRQQAEDILAGRRRFDLRVWRWLNLTLWSERLGIEY